MLPGVHGVIQTDDRAHVLFSLHGRTILVNSGADRRGHQNLAVIFEADDRDFSEIYGDSVKSMDQNERFERLSVFVERYEAEVESTA